ncbi:hypothetical protein L4174_019870 [Photobacterium sp. CCB-ST2H9]|uniref:alpha/beta hydrolase n=1 Tax=Photobacterium sp. CCB-ST2H9 TaxID=2912855 RepID=UPI002002A4A7|nr:hypothetical protein [Photobacterium sp. CCB-ST2H9]UTM60312.1 hypothetical protein L4174_019870 [Photobacterium sp. CCB-ST2H9]
MKPKLLFRTCMIVVLWGLAGCHSDDNTTEKTPEENQGKNAAAHVYPAPGGPYRVGVKAFDLLDAGPDGMSPVPETTRRLPVKVFYPTQENSGQYQGYFDSWGHQISYLERVRPEDKPIHPNQFELSSILSWSRANAQIAPPESGTGWPVLIYSHGAFLFEVDNTELLEDLASRGYVVVSINHTYISGIASFQDGSAISAYVPEDSDDVDTDKGFAYFDQVIAPQIIHDVFYVYQWLTWHPELFDYQLDDTRIGTLGYSLGGSAAMNSCAQIAACVASANMDGLLLGKVREQPLNKPLLLMQTPEQTLAEAFADNGHETYLLTIAHTTHSDFMDQNRWVVGYPSGIDIDQMHQIKKQSMATFFGHYLKDTDLFWPEHEALTLEVK